MRTWKGRLVSANGKGLPSRATGALCGVLAAAVAIGVAQLLAGLSIPQASPVLAVGQAAIDLTPLPVKDWATSTFGTNDKNALLTGVFVVLFLYAAGIGAVAVRRLALGMAGLALFAVIGLAAALTRPSASAAYALPTLAGALAGAFALYRLVVTARRGSAAAAAESCEPPTCLMRCIRRNRRAPTSRRCAGRCRSRRRGARSWRRLVSPCSPPRSAR